MTSPPIHLDIVSKEVLEQALNRYTGTVFFVSHDRYFINTVATRILDLADETLTNYIGNYDYYLEKKETMTNFTSAPSSTTVSVAEESMQSESKLDWKQQKEQQALLRKRQNDLKKVESRIEELETRDKEIDELLPKKKSSRMWRKSPNYPKKKMPSRPNWKDFMEEWETLSE